MNVFFLSSSKDDTAKRLLRVLEHLLPKKNIKYFRTVNELKENLRKPLPEMALVVILKVNKERLLELLPLKELFENESIILILHKKDDETVALGHRLRPRFVTYSDSDFLDVASVLIKLKERARNEIVHE